MKDREPLMRDYNCLWRSIVEAAQENRKYPSLGDPARETAYKRGAAFARLVEISKKHPPPDPQTGGKLILKGARQITEALGGELTVKAIRSERHLKQRLAKGDVIVLQHHGQDPKTELHAEYIPPRKKGPIETERILKVVNKKSIPTNPFNIIEIKWKK